MLIYQTQAFSRQAVCNMLAIVLCSAFGQLCFPRDSLAQDMNETKGSIETSMADIVSFREEKWIVQVLGANHRREDGSQFRSDVIVYCRVSDRISIGVSKSDSNATVRINKEVNLQVPNGSVVVISSVRDIAVFRDQVSFTCDVEGEDEILHEMLEKIIRKHGE